MTTALKQPKPKPQTQGKRPSTLPSSHLRAVKHRKPVRNSQQRSNHPPLTLVSGAARAKVQPLPTKRPFPIWLKFLIQLQRGSLIVTSVLVVAALVVYGSTIYMQQHWSKEYRKLKTMQRSERQMIAASEYLKNQIMQQAEQPGSGLVPRTSAHTLFLEPTSLRPPIAPNPILIQKPSSNSDPMGY